MSRKTKEKVRKLNLNNTKEGVIYITRWQSFQAAFYLFVMGIIYPYVKINVESKEST